MDRDQKIERILLDKAVGKFAIDLDSDFKRQTIIELFNLIDDELGPKQLKSIFEPFIDGIPVKFCPNKYIQERELYVFFNPEYVKKEFNIDDFVSKVVQASGLASRSDVYPSLGHNLSPEEKKAMKIQNMGFYGVFGKDGLLGTQPTHRPFLFDVDVAEKIAKEGSEHLHEIKEKFKTHGIEGTNKNLIVTDEEDNENIDSIIEASNSPNKIDISEEIKFNDNYLKFDTFFKLVGTQIILHPIDGEYFHCGQRFTYDELNGNLSKMVEKYTVDVDTFEAWSQSDYLEQLQELKAESFNSMVGSHCYYSKHSYGVHKILEWSPKRGEFKITIEGDLGGTFWTHPLRILAWSNVIADLEKEKSIIKKTE